MQRFISARRRGPTQAQRAVSPPDRQFLLLILTGLIVATIGSGLGALATAMTMASFQ